jgi:hypothetical protein
MKSGTISTSKFRNQPPGKPMMESIKVQEDHVHLLDKKDSGECFNRVFEIPEPSG